MYTWDALCTGAIERVRIDPITKEARFRVIGEERWSDVWVLGENAPLDQQPRHLTAGICGSGIIEAVADLYLAGVLLANGSFNPNVHSRRMQWDRPIGAYVLATKTQTTNGQPILVTQSEVRNIQLTKAANKTKASILKIK